MNPFHFVSLPPNGPLELTNEALSGKRLEGYITFELKVLTPVIITGQIDAVGRNDDFLIRDKYFYTRYGQPVIPGASIRGMLAAFIEALTGSDLACFTRGNEPTGEGKTSPYEKGKNSRKTGFLMAAEDDDRFNKINKEHYGIRNTLPNGFGQGRKEDIARFLFGHVPEEEKDPEREKKEHEESSKLKAQSGRICIEDMVIKPQQLDFRKGLDIKGKVVFGSPNPRANTAWYFTPGRFDYRKINDIFWVWDVFADKIRGRKFYFHQDPDCCLKYYQHYWNNFITLKEYNLQVLKEGEVVGNGRIYFSDLPENLLHLLTYSLQLPENNMAHKLGGLKAFGFGSVRLRIKSIHCQTMEKGVIHLGDLRRHTNWNQKEIGNLCYEPARQILKKIMHYPKAEMRRHYLFFYPTSGMEKNDEPWMKAFSTPESHRGHQPPATYPSERNRKKITMFFDDYQKNSVNYAPVMES